MSSDLDNGQRVAVHGGDDLVERCSRVGCEFVRVRVEYNVLPNLVLECIELVEAATGRPLARTYEDSPRIGDHICYVSDTRRFRASHPDWELSTTLPEMIDEMVRAALGAGREVRCA